MLVAPILIIAYVYLFSDLFATAVFTDVIET